MKKTALYGYGVFGKRTAESFRFYWGEEYQVTAIFDRDRAGEDDSYWGLKVLSPEYMCEEYRKGTFEAVMICICDEVTRSSIRKQITSLDIPVFVPGRAEDFAEPGSFPEDKAVGIDFHMDDYSLHVYRDMLGAVADFASGQIMFLFDENGRLNIGNYSTYPEDFEELMLMYPFRLRDPVPERVNMEGDWCVITRAYSPNYWHFTFETADCVYLLESAGYRGKYIFNDLPFARELLQIMGISPDRLVGTKELEIHKVYAFERLFYVERSGLGKMECSAEVISGMAALIRSELEKKESLPKRIYVRRIGRRKLLNGEETAVRNGFTVIVPEEHSVREQMELFYNADIVLCPHGANSANCLYMHKGAVFAEIFSDRWHMEINKDICAANGVHYIQIVGNALSDRPKDVDADYSVDVHVLQRMILAAEEIIAGRQMQEV